MPWKECSGLNRVAFYIILSGYGARDRSESGGGGGKGLVWLEGPCVSIQSLCITTRHVRCTATESCVYIDPQVMNLCCRCYCGCHVLAV